PAAAVTAEDADLITYLAAEGETRMHLVLTPQTLPDIESANVIADIKGSEHPEQVVIVSGHLDSWDLGTGAIDDGAGAAVAMETAHLVRQLHLKPKRTVRVIAWINEENGSRGSTQYEKDHASEFANHFAVNETDGGAGHPTGLNLKTNPEVKKIFEPVAKILQEIGAGTLNLAEHAGADIEPMEKAGVPAFAPIQDSRFYFNYHHTPADTLDKIVPKELAENSAIVAVFRRPTRWIRLCRRSWRKIPQSSRCSPTRWRIQSKRCRAEMEGHALSCPHKKRTRRSASLQK